MAAFGYLAWFNIPTGLTVTQEELIGRTLQTGIPVDFLPAQPNPVDAFRLSTSNFLSGHSVDNGCFVSYFIRNKQRGAGFISRRMERQKVDNSGKIIEQNPEVVLFTLHKGTGKLTVKANEQTEEVYNLIREIRGRYEHYRRNYNHTAIRGMVNRYMAALAAVRVNNYGVLHFVPGRFGEQLAGLIELLRGIGASGGFIEMPDSQNVREIVKNSIHGTLKRALDNYRPPRKPGTTNLPARTLLASLDFYRQLLGDPLTDLQPMIDDLTRKFRKEVADF